MTDQKNITPVNVILESLCQGNALKADEAQAFFSEVFAGAVDPAQLAAVLTALKMKGETADEIRGAARAMTQAALPFPRPADVEVGEIVGTGGDGFQTINVSTTAAIAAAGMGLHIAKHGNRGVSSKSGASDVLTALGINIKPDPERAAQLLKTTGFAFCFAQLYHPAMRFAGPVRASLKVRTIFNILGPLTNPAHPDYALIGVYDPALLMTVAETLKGLGMKRAFVVHGSGLDEVAVHGATQAVELKEDGSFVEHVFTPADFGVKNTYAIEDIRGGSPQENAKIAEAILAGGGTAAQHDLVAVNLALLLLLGRKASSVSQACALAHEALQSGLGLKVLAAHRAAAREDEVPFCERRAA